MTTPPFGLLLDVDGPIANPDSRAISIPRIIENLITLAETGVPVIFNTGRSDDFINKQVVEPLLEYGFPKDVTMYAVCEKGATWAEITSAGMGKVHVDKDKALPADYISQSRELVHDKYAEYMFFDETKHTMVSVEQHEGSDNDVYHEQQKFYDNDAAKLFKKLDIPAVLNGKNTSDEEPEFIIEPTIISTDIQSMNVGKDVGAERAVELAKETHTLPKKWYSVGDSRSDYAMADWLDENGYESTFVDCRPVDGVPEKDYEIKTYGKLINDEVGAEFLQDCVAELNKN